MGTRGVSYPPIPDSGNSAPRLTVGSAPSKRLTVLFMDSTDSWGGGEVWVMDMLAGLRERGHRPLVVCPKASELSRRAAERGHHVIPVRIGGDLDPLVIAALRRVMIRQGVDAVVATTDKDLRRGGIAARLAGGVCVVATREVDTPVKPTAAYRFAYNVLATTIVVNSESTKQTLLRSAPWLGEEKVRVIYKGIRIPDPATIPPAGIRPQFQISRDAPVVCFVGRLDKQKGIAFLLEAWRAIVRDHDQARLLLVGEGNLRPFVEDFVAAHGLERSVHLTGLRDDVPGILQESTLLVLPSLWEGFGYAAAEAMAAGLPVVATATSSLPEIVQDGATGILVEPESPEQLSQAVSSLLSDPPRALRLGESGRRRVQEKFSFSSMIDAYEEVLHSRCT